MMEWVKQLLTKYYYRFSNLTCWVLKILGNSDQENISDLLLFWTCHPTLPVDTSAKLTVTFLLADPSKVLPEANTCPMVLFLPTIHKEFNQFRASMDKAISFGKYGFGKM